MKKCLFILLFIQCSFVFSQSSAPVVTQASLFGSAGYDSPFTLKKDDHGNMYLSGTFSGTVSFGGFTLTSAGGMDIFVVKMDPLGNVLWATRGGGANYDYVGDIAIDQIGNVYVTGDFRGNGTFGHLSATAATNTNNIFVGKINANGTWSWVRKAGSSGGEASRGLNVDQSGNVYITGTYFGTCVFGTINLPNTSAGNFDLFLAKLDNNGTWIWAKRVGGAGQEFGRNLGVDNYGNVYVNGVANDQVNVESFTMSRGMFVLKYDPAGVLIWRRSIPCNSINENSDIVIDTINSCLYIGGSISANISIGSNNHSVSNADIFIAKLDLDNNLLWSKTTGGSNNQYLDRISLSENQDLLIAGSYYLGNATIGGVTLVAPNTYYNHAYIARIDKNSNWEWVRNFPGGTGISFAKQIIENGLGNYILVGEFHNTIQLDQVVLTSGGDLDIFITTMVDYCPPSNSVDYISACSSYTWTNGNGQTYTSSATATHTIPNGAVNGCDSIVTLNLTIPPPVSSTINQTSCGSFTWTSGNGQTYTSSTTATHTIPNGAVNGCDSIVTLNLTIPPPVSSTINQTSCGSFTWTNGNGQTYTSSTTATHTIPNGAVNGCDSIVTLNLTIPPPVSSTINQTSCGSFTWTSGNGQTYTSSTTATHTIPNGAVNGCDSIVTLNLTILPPVSSTINQTSCGSFTWTNGNGQTYTSSTTATHTIPNGAVNGCDSIVTLNLTIPPPVSSTINQTSCGSFTWTSGNGQTYTSSTTATHTIPNGAVNGCDSIVTLNLTIHTIDSSVSQNGTTLTANQPNANYQWIDCDSNLPITGEIHSSFTAVINGSYAVEITLNGCVETSSCSIISGIGVVDHSLIEVNIFPNPSAGIFTVQHGIQTGETRMEVYNSVGQLLFIRMNISFQEILDLTHMQSGIYFVKIIQEETFLKEVTIIKK